MYSSKLEIQIGNVPILTSSDLSGDESSSEELDPEIYGRDLGIGIPVADPEYRSRNKAPKAAQTILSSVISHNGDKLSTNQYNRGLEDYYQSGILKLVCLKQEIHHITFIPNLKIIKECVYKNLDYADLKNLQYDIKHCSQDSYIILSFLDVDPENIPDNFIYYLKNKLMSQFISKVKLPDKTTDLNKNWVMLLHKLPTTSASSQIQTKNHIHSNIFKNNPRWNRLHTATKQNLELINNKINWDIKYQNNGNLVYLGESLSTNLANQN